jgi:uncharacterized protein YbaP (TraB family)
MKFGPLGRLIALLLFTVGLATPAMAEPALWKVTGPDTTIWLFGTVHVLKPDTVWDSPRIDAAIKSADALWLEIPDADDAAAMQGLIVRYGVDPAHPLSSKLDDATRAQFSTFLTGLGADPAQMEPLRPWVAAVMVSTLPLIKAGFDPGKGVEHVVKAQVQAAGKPVQGFETAEQQIRYLADVTPAEELDFFKQSLADGQKATQIVNAMITAWVGGDEPKLEALLNSDMRDGYPNLYKRLIVERNQRFAQKIADLVKGHGVQFVAVGAGHLVGADSIQADLAKLGITAVRQ